MMNKTLVLVLASVLAGCAHNATPPLDVRQIPNDCANRNAILRWLSTQASIPKQPLEQQEDYERHRASIRHRIWDMRYNCQPR